jgi:hypothetical protein
MGGASTGRAERRGTAQPERRYSLRAGDEALPTALDRNSRAILYSTPEHSGPIAYYTSGSAYVASI